MMEVIQRNKRFWAERCWGRPKIRHRKGVLVDEGDGALLLNQQEKKIIQLLKKKKRKRIIAESN